jgi:hypothetical protein
VLLITITIRWREQQAVALSRQRETAYAEGDSIARSLSAFARKRGDIFGRSVKIAMLQCFSLSQ